MFNYLRGELFRVSHKKSMYIYFGALALAYLIFVFIRAGNLTGSSMASDAETLFFLLPAVVGGYLFAALYTDDLNARNLSALIGFDMSKTGIVLSKLILISLFGALAFGLVPLYMYALYAVFGQAVTAAALGSVYALALKALLATVAFSVLSGVAVYGLQRATFGMVTYILLSLGLVSQILGALLNWELVASLLPGLSSHLMSGILARILVGTLSGGKILGAALEYAVYVAAAAFLSILAFKKKELEF